MSSTLEIAVQHGLAFIHLATNISLVTNSLPPQTRARQRLQCSEDHKRNYYKVAAHLSRAHFHPRMLSSNRDWSFRRNPS